MQKFKILGYEKESGLIYFAYEGGIPTSAKVILSWRSLTIHVSHFNFSDDKSVIYFIGPQDKEVCKIIDEFKITIEIGNEIFEYYVKISEKKESFPFLDNFDTNKDDVSFHTFYEIFSEKFYENSLLNISEGDVVVDIGTNYGFFVQSILDKNPDKVFCYEPSPNVFKHTKKNFSDNKKIILNNFGVSSFNGTTKFLENNCTSSSRISEELGGIEVKVISINSLIDNIGPKINYMKIDCEGCEEEIFNSITFENLQKIDKIVVEYHSEEIKNLITKKLLESNFIIHEIKNKIIFSYKKNIYQKKVALISTFCNDENKQQILKENIIKLKELGLDVIAISPIPIAQEIVNLCDYFFYTKDNPLLKWPVRMYTHWYEMPISNGRITTLQRGLADYGWAGLYQVKKLSQIALSFDYDIFYHLIYDLEIDEVVEQELKSNKTNIIHPRRDPHHPETLWETTLHFMVFDRKMMEKIEKEITLEEYLGTNGVAEGEVFKWKKKFGIPGSEHPVKDKIFYWENYDFFDYSPFEDFKFFPSKNEKITVWLGESPIYPSELSTKLRLVFHGFSHPIEINLSINGKNYQLTPNPWEIIELDEESINIWEFIIKYKNEEFDFTQNYREIMMNQVYYNHRP